MYTQFSKETHHGKLPFLLGRVQMNFVVYSISNMILQGSLDLDPGSQGESMNSWCVSFETEFI